MEFVMDGLFIDGGVLLELVLQNPVFKLENLL